MKTANGVTLKVDVKDLYGRSANSWCVDSTKSLFVELPPAQVGSAEMPLTAKDLAPADEAHAVRVCTAAGVTKEALLDDFKFDTTVLKDDAAVRIFTKSKLVIRD